MRRVAPFDAADVLRRLCDDLRPVAEARGLYLKAVGVATLPVEGDAVKVRRIAQNLLLNALKYTESGGVLVGWGDTVARDDGRWVLTVEDTGPGFHAGPGAPLVSALSATPGEPLAAPSADDDARPVHQAHGEGLGLAIVKRLSELLDASIEFDTEPGKGTTVRVLVPMRYSPRRPGSATGRPLGARAGRRHSISIPAEPDSIACSNHGRAPQPRLAPGQRRRSSAPIGRARCRRRRHLMIGVPATAAGVVLPHARRSVAEHRSLRHAGSAARAISRRVCVRICASMPSVAASAGRVPRLQVRRRSAAFASALEEVLAKPGHLLSGVGAR